MKTANLRNTPLDPAGPTCYLKTSSAGRVRSVGALSGVPLITSTSS
ncbi:hypothetical protein PF003_g29611 [Phytophthora fragariae]|nr:hypothetical protein PF003_g29611 [Phytophthora fragariae]